MKKNERAHLVLFSPTRTSAKIARAVGKGTGMECVETDLTYDSGCSPVVIKDSWAVIAVPVYAGRVAPVALQRLRRIRGENTPVILVVVYGNRDYEDALMELHDEVLRLGFLPFAAGAFVGEHSYSRLQMPIAAGRPDVDDLRKAEHLGEDALRKWQTAGTGADFFIRGNRPYREVAPSTPAAPVSEEGCNGCGECIPVCPTQAISLNSERVIRTVAESCIKCCACVRVCPVGERTFHTPYTAMLHAKCSVRREPETFL